MYQLKNQLFGDILSATYKSAFLAWEHADRENSKRVPGQGYYVVVECEDEQVPR